MEKTKMEKILDFFNNFPIINFLKGQGINLGNGIKLVHSQSDEASSKRFYGGIIILNCIIVFDLFAKGIFPIVHGTDLYSAGYSLLFIGAALISISTLEKLANIIANFKIDTFMKKSASTTNIIEEKQQ